MSGLGSNLTESGGAVKWGGTFSPIRAITKAAPVIMVESSRRANCAMCAAPGFVWLVSNEILLEYKQVLGKLGVRRPLIGKIINLLREEAEPVPAWSSCQTSLPIPEMIPSARALKLAGPILS